ncbi:hypothetical protein AMAG_02387 [Allomyces macrogynus ATCC 38327]|uniref:Acyl-protein thioesterase 1 n=1 Tax=Allomyces macrogynus (strain ATCC 38327) TaxID=578462 RepID=A0A0L0S222_ALLM3|nr:hypothetical protein AMAG_02387 [Allomyces macrogynus ATCC 38327]|eukprot:KNE56593.1 hypothetical protein AMAG_02387 [Allomyces macrogynus ATCC 38327]
MSAAAKPLLDAVIQNAKAKHTASVIFLHGLGDSGAGWAGIAPMLANALPHVKWVFPNAPVQPVTLNMGMRMPSWYDIYSLDREQAKQDEKGMLESAGKIQDLINNEVEKHGIPTDRIVVGGFSQGSAISLLTLVTSPVKLAAIVALSGYLPLTPKFDELHKTVNDQTPVWMGHGDSDEVVAYKWGSQSAEFLKEKGYNVDFNTYRWMGHSANDQELMDLTMFLKNVIP